MSFEKDFIEQNFRSLYRKIYKTSKARFNAHSRLKAQYFALHWSLSFFSLGLIVIPLIRLSGLQISIDSKILDLLQITLAMFVLVYSLILSSSHSKDKIEKMHRCGLELNHLAREMLPYCKDEGEFDIEVYNKYQDKYSLKLNAYDNHSKIDFAFYKLENLDEYPLSWIQRNCIIVKYFLYYWPSILLVVIGISIMAYIAKNIIF
jgi:hypothetical protein